MLCMEGNIDIGHSDTTKVSFEWMFEQYYTSLVKYAYTMLRDQDEAEDVVQTVFSEFWAGRNKIQVHSSAKALLYKSVYFRSLNYLKRKKAERVRNMYLETSEAVESNDLLELEDLDQRIKAAIDLLPQQCKKIFLLSRINELKYKEIADKMGLSIKTIENQMGKALQIMRNELKDYLIITIILFNLFTK